MSEEIVVESEKNWIANIVKEQSAFSGDIYRTSKILYISDLHLDSHCAEWGMNMSLVNSNDKNLAFEEIKKYKAQFKKIILQFFNKEVASELSDSLFSLTCCAYPAQMNRKYKYVILIGGDIADNPYIYEYFVKNLNIYFKFNEYKKWKKTRIDTAEKSIEDFYNYQLDIREKELKNRIKSVQKWFRYNSKTHSAKTYYEIVEKLKNKPAFVSNRIREIKRLETEIKKLSSNEDIKLRKIRERVYFSESVLNELPIFTVLGNHELSWFNTVNEAVSYYSNICKQYRIHLLQNEFIEAINVKRPVEKENLADYLPFNIYGGIGFAEYNGKFNCENMRTAKQLTRELECGETEKFVEEYNKALSKSINDEVPLVVLVHFPLEDWMAPSEYPNSHCIYFTGHTHRNLFTKEPNKLIYANNQVGYKKNRWELKCAEIGLICNPFVSYTNGYYKINTLQYKRFMEFSGENMQGTGLIDKAVETYNSTFYMIKYEGIYGFFVISNLGTSICLGGRYKKISKVKNIEYFYQCFCEMINHYANALTPFRKAEEQLSSELIRLGFDGTIHGCIIDINFTHHIMLNPVDGKITFYYSPFFGSVQDLGSFKNVLKSINEKEAEELCSANEPVCNEKEILSLALQSNMSLLSINDINIGIGDLQIVETSGGMYGLSKKMYNSQRLFTRNILRDWDDEFAKSFIQSLPDCQSLITDTQKTAKERSNITAENKED